MFINDGLRAAVPGVIDVDKERERLARELKKVTKELTAVEKKLGNAKFLERAPAEVVEKSKSDAAQLRTRSEQLAGALERLG